MFASDGTLLAASEAISSRYLQGLYEFDGDPATQELLLVSKAVGGGIQIVGASTMALLWESPDPGNNGGSDNAETLVLDVDGDGIDDEDGCPD